MLAGNRPLVQPFKLVCARAILTFLISTRSGHSLIFVIWTPVETHVSTAGKFRERKCGRSGMDREVEEVEGVRRVHDDGEGN
ncbi:hypothetical protein CPAR01_06214 [Colletotrichum paranaense]|uniref:Secreted protein n=1 Tax=Colletotrichum paranaense TaxID=1914294 RepID=A0ABQ9SUR0_9PEZI|nr:uncharacterized protein CPAR01_06214 [Colletotrichum paranaense]KAK1542827.1 hypothetical protein CPAR01_06214 [Colletotrichum paranaense]